VANWGCSPNGYWKCAVTQGKPGRPGRWQLKQPYMCACYVMSGVGCGCEEVDCRRTKLPRSVVTSCWRSRWLAVWTTRDAGQCSAEIFHQFLPHCSYAAAVLPWASVCPSICPSIHETCELWQNERNLCPNSYTISKANTSSRSFLTWRMVGGGCPLLREFGSKWPIPFKNVDS